MKISTITASGGTGFFAYTHNAEIKNLTIVGNINITTTGAAQTGGLIGQSNNTVLSGNIRSEVNITVTNTVNNDVKNGGVIGELTKVLLLPTVIYLTKES